MVALVKPDVVVQGGGEPPAAALGSLPAPSQQDSSQESGVSAALSDLLHMGMTAMQARAQRRCILEPCDGPNQACVKEGTAPAPPTSSLAEWRQISQHEWVDTPKVAMSTTSTPWVKKGCL